MKTDIEFRSYLTEYFLEWKMFQTKVVEKIKTHFVFGFWFFFVRFADRASQYIYLSN